LASSKHIALTILPWPALWLYRNSIWLVTGNLNGGGIEHGADMKSAAQMEKL
jgi:hypothetical protein